MEEHDHQNRYNQGIRRSNRLRNKRPFSKFVNTADNPADVDNELDDGMEPIGESPSETHSKISKKPNQPSRMQGYSSENDFCEDPKETIKLPKETDKEPTNRQAAGDNLERKKKVKKTPGSLRTRTSPKALYDTVKLLTEEQKQAVRDIGLGSLLCIRLDGIPGNLGYYVVDNFNPTTKRITLKNNGFLETTVESIHKMLLLPYEGADLLSLEVSEKGKELANKWTSQYDKQKVRPKDVQVQINKKKDAGLRFKVNFIVLAMNVLGGCSRVGECEYKFLLHLPDIHTITKVNWCKYIWDCLADSKEGWRRDNADSFYVGPLTYLTMLYVESTSCAGPDVKKDVSPLRRWTLDLLRERQNIEIANGGLGFAPIKNNRTNSLRTQVGETSTSRVKNKEIRKQELVDRLDDLIMTSTSAKTELELELVDAINEFPDDVDFERLKLEFASVFKGTRWDNESDPKADFKDVQEDTTPTTMKHRKAIEQIIGSSTIAGTSSTRPHQRNEIRPINIDLKTPTPGERKNSTPGIPNFDIGSSSGSTTSKAIVIANPDAEPIRMEPHIPTPASIGFKRAADGDGPIVANLRTPHSNASHPTNVHNISSPTFDLGISPDKAPSHPNEDRYRKKRLRKVGESLKSPYLQRAVTFDVTSDEKKILNWVLKGVGTQEEEIFEIKNSHTITRGQMRTLADEAGIVATEVINGWVSVLNEQEEYRSSNSPKRLFLRTNVAQDWKILDDQFTPEEKYTSFVEHLHECTNGTPEVMSFRAFDLVFFPVVQQQHYYVIVYNLKVPCVYVIDSEDRDEDEVDIYNWQIAAVIGMMKRHLRITAHPNWQYFELLSADKAELRWQTKKSKFEKGVILMRNMEVYMGQDNGSWESGIFKESPRQKNQVKSLRAKYVAKILNSPVNGRKEGIAPKVFAFMAMEATAHHRKRRA